MLKDLDLDDGALLEESSLGGIAPAHVPGGYKLRALLLFVPYPGFRDPTIE